MFTNNKEDFLTEAVKTLGDIYDQIAAAPVLNLSELKPADTALLIVDMVNGFVKEGPLASPRVAAIVPAVTQIARHLESHNYPVVVFADCHEQNSPEFEAYPPHCLAGTAESKVIDELQPVKHLLISKGSTNGFLEESFQVWLRENPQITNFIIVGDCTDICVDQLAKTLKAYFTAGNHEVRVIVIMEATATFDFGLHNGDLMQLVALYGLVGAGVEVKSRLELND